MNFLISCHPIRKYIPLTVEQACEIAQTGVQLLPEVTKLGPQLHFSINVELKCSLKSSFISQLLSLVDRKCVYEHKIYSSIFQHVILGGISHQTTTHVSIECVVSLATSCQHSELSGKMRLFYTVYHKANDNNNAYPNGTLENPKS